MHSDASYCDFEDIFFVRHPFASNVFFPGIEPLFWKIQNSLFLQFPAYYVSRSNPDALRGFPELAGLANRAFYAVFQGVTLLIVETWSYPGGTFNEYLRIRWEVCAGD